MASSLWLQRVLEVKQEWHRANFKKLAVILEIKAQLQNFKATFASGSNRRLPRQANKALATNVRGMVLLMKADFQPCGRPFPMTLQEEIETGGP